ncbi:MAG: 50S ribosomal protein L11 methyltransferase [Spirochaetota bacterium]|nr:50S ribosomal protein L11 methyltransferase [Spirochaetota bacterium]
MYEKLYIYEIEGEVRPGFESEKPEYIGCWIEAGYSYLFFSGPSEIEIDRILSKHHCYRFTSKIVMDYDQWEPACAMKPFYIAPFSFVPAWAGIGKNNNKFEIRLDSGVVFGAGTHNTTHMCIQFIVDIMKEKKIERVIDLGTGTGILAITAAKLEASKVIAIDNNRLAVQTAEKNIKINMLQDVIECKTTDASNFFEVKADLIVANLVIGVLQDLFLPDYNYNSNWYIISGLKNSEILTFKKQIECLPLNTIRNETRGGWSTLLLERIH